ncbi:MAG: hypothetical protein K0S08_251 [Gammaproteobacteria bacterium]|jgi:hypothetical protein|nr:hypothetical protein [Gammaproteobacteria bacterium]
MRFYFSEKLKQLNESGAAQLIIKKSTSKEDIAELLVCFAFSLEVASAIQQRKRILSKDSKLGEVDEQLLQQLISISEQDANTAAATLKIHSLSEQADNPEVLVNAYKIACTQARYILHADRVSLFNFLLVDGEIDDVQLQSNVKFLLENLPAQSLTAKIFNALLRAAQDKRVIFAHYEKNLSKIQKPFNDIQMDFIYDLVTESKLPRIMPIMKGAMPELDGSISALYVKAAVNFQESTSKTPIKEKISAILSASPDFPTLHFLTQVYWEQIPDSLKAENTSNIFFEARGKSTPVLSILIAEKPFQLSNTEANSPYLQELLFEESTRSSESNIAPLLFLYRKLPVLTDEKFLTRIQLEVQRRCSCFPAQEGPVLVELLSKNPPLLQKFIDNRALALKIFRSLSVSLIQKNAAIIPPVFFPESPEPASLGSDDEISITSTSILSSITAEDWKKVISQEGEAPAWLKTVFERTDKRLLFQLLESTPLNYHANQAWLRPLLGDKNNLYSFIQHYSFKSEEELENFIANHLHLLQEIVLDSTQAEFINSHKNLFSKLAIKYFRAPEIEKILTPGTEAPEWLQSVFKQRLDLFSAALNTHLPYAKNQNWLNLFLQDINHLECFIKNYSFKDDQELESFITDHRTSLKKFLLDKDQAALVSAHSALFKKLAITVLAELTPNELITLILQEVFEEQDLIEHNFEPATSKEALAFLIKDDQWRQLPPKGLSSLILLAGNDFFEAAQSSESLIQEKQELTFQFILHSSENKDKEKLLAVLEKLLIQSNLIEGFYSSKCIKTQEQVLEWLNKNPGCETLCFTNENFIRIAIHKGYRFTKLQEQKILITCSKLQHLFQLPDLQNALQAILIRQFENLFREQKATFTATALAAELYQLQSARSARQEFKIIVSQEPSFDLPAGFLASIQILICSPQIRNLCWPALMSSPRLIQQFIDAGDEIIWQSIFDDSGNYASELQSTLSQYSGKALSLVNFERFYSFATSHVILHRLLLDIVNCFKQKTSSSTNSSTRSSRAGSPLHFMTPQSQSQQSYLFFTQSNLRHSTNSLSSLAEKATVTNSSPALSPTLTPSLTSPSRSLFPPPMVLDTVSPQPISDQPTTRQEEQPSSLLEATTTASTLPRRVSAPTTPTSNLSKPTHESELTERLRQQLARIESQTPSPLSPQAAPAAAAAATTPSPVITKKDSPLTAIPVAAAATPPLARTSLTPTNIASAMTPERKGLLTAILQGATLRKTDSPQGKKKEEPSEFVKRIMALRPAVAGSDSDTSTETDGDVINPPGAFGSPPAGQKPG